jgi:hypothetical protein
VTNAGQGTLLLNGINTYTGNTINGGVLGGSGTIAGNVSSSGNVRPGNSPGTLTINGDFAQSAASGSLDFELNGPTPGTEYDRIAVTGTVTLGGKHNVALNYAAPTGQVFTIIENAGTDAIIGTLAGKPEGSTIVSGGRALRISYIGGDGNDVTLTVLPPPTVTEVFVSGTTWQSTFRDFLATSGAGDATLGYRLDAAAHADELPWTNLNRLSVRFSEDVTLGSAAAFRVLGVNVAEYVGTFTYDAATFTATWTLTAGTFTADKLLVSLDDALVAGAAGGPALDGEWTNPTPPAAGGADLFPSGDGTAGGDFNFRLNVLPGDVNRNGIVQSNDALPIQASLLAVPGSAGYTIFKDVNGNGILQASDFLNVQSRLLNALPAGEPVAPAPIVPPSAKRRSPFSTSEKNAIAMREPARLYDVLGSDLDATQLN